MTTLEKFVMGAIAIGMITALTLPDRQTARVLDAATRFTTGVLRTSITGR